MERRVITFFVVLFVGRFFYLFSDKVVFFLDKIVKRECKVLVVEFVK